MIPVVANRNSVDASELLITLRGAYSDASISNGGSFRLRVASAAQISACALERLQFPRQLADALAHSVAGTLLQCGFFVITLKREDRLRPGQERPQHR
jgi:hypothetical protein